ncbi:MAG: hypothetical protein N2513_00615 [Deltaproteobacteria bacterium]|nr:hypothetical protein [Deltaproteobacteria bacterium]
MNHAIIEIATVVTGIAYGLVVFIPLIGIFAGIFKTATKVKKEDVLKLTLIKKPVPAL